MKRTKDKRRIRLNAWGNWNGYIGKHKVIEFGTDEQRAKNWLDGASEPIPEPLFMRVKELA